jgi:hypothetical protein
MAKLYDLKVVTVTFTSVDLPDVDVFKKYFRDLVLWTENTRSGFKHCAQFESFPASQVACNYQNRTWESYQYESVIKKAIAKYIELTGRKVNYEIEI